MPEGVESPMKPQLVEQIIEKLETFPDSALREILNHIDLLETSTDIVSQQQPTGNPQKNAWDILESLTGTVEAPPDWSSEHDHYLYGTPRHQNIEE
jgi:hypothetical protein